MKIWQVLLLVVVFCVRIESVSAAPIVPDSFSTTWDTSATGVDGESSFNQVAFSLGESGFDACSGVLYWEEIGNDVNNGTSTLDSGCNLETITFPTEGNYRVDVSGTFPTFKTDDYNKLLTVEQWGNNVWEKMDRMFENKLQLTSVGSDAPDLSAVTDLSNLFNDAAHFNSAINHWNVSNITNMSGMFAGATAFNQDLSSWDVSNVTTMGAYGETNCDGGDGMFKEATAFNQDLSSWDISSVVYLCEMFFGATNFDQDVGTWDISAVTNMSNLFDDTNLSAENYSNILNSWAALPAVESNVTLDANNSIYLETASTARQHLIDTYGWTINDAGLFVEPPDNEFITVWDTRLDPSTPNELSIYANDGSSYNFYIDWGDGTVEHHPLNPGGYINHTYSTPGIKTVTITGTFPYFYGGGDDGPQYNKLIDVAQWGTTVWEDFEFFESTYLTGFSATDIPDLSNVTSMSGMFVGATTFNGDVSNWDVSNITYMNSMFKGATAFNGDVSDWDVSNVTSMGYMFYGATAFNQPLNSWEVSYVTDMDEMLTGTAFTEAKYTLLLNSWSTLPVQPDVHFNTDAQYCGATAQDARDILTGAPNNWVIIDGGATTECMIEVDEEIEENNGSAGGSSGTRIGDRIKSFFYSSTTTSTPLVVTTESFMQGLLHLIDTLTKSEDQIANLSSAERANIIIGLRDIIKYLLSLLSVYG